MMAGVIHTEAGSRPGGQSLSVLAAHIGWEQGVAEYFSYEGFSAVVITDARLAATRGDVFYLDERRGLAVLVDGYIYNRSDLICQLLPDSGALPALVAAAYLQWGDTFADHLNGDFAICIYHGKERRLLFCRDHLGLRPLALSHAGDTVSFATDPMGLCKALQKEGETDPHFLLNMFLEAGRDYMRLPHKDVVAVRPGHYFCISPAGQAHRPYWFPENIHPLSGFTRAQVCKELGWLLADAVRVRADRRFTAAAHVSGGLDSGLVAAMARKAYGAQPGFYGFSWSPPWETQPDKGRRDERHRVEATCHENNIVPVFCGFDDDDYLAFLSGWRHPSELVFERNVVAAAKDRAVTLIFSGWGGDEFISMADRGIATDLVRSAEWKALLRKYRPWQLKKFLPALQSALALAAARRAYGRHKADKAVYPYIRKALGSNRIPRRKRFCHNVRQDVHLQLLALHHLGARAADWYVLGQRNGIEYRYPLLDIRIVEHMLKVQSHCLVDGSKDRVVIRELGKGMLPNRVLTNASKEDPARTERIRAIAHHAKKQFVNERNTFRNNPALSFVDFEKLEKDLPGIMARATKDQDEDALAVFFYLKNAHEFTKGYCR